MYCHTHTHTHTHTHNTQHTEYHHQHQYNECVFSVHSLSENQSLMVMPPWVNFWLLAAMALSMTLHFIILYVDILSVSVASVCMYVCLSDLLLLDESLKFLARNYTDGETTSLLRCHWIVVAWAIYFTYIKIDPF
ncbi:Calcium-transporting ATPase sarcoplasmic/endoplasmic reticulum type [Portunus trituberculatus]|uniref:Calcium-transporting ATPase sarcoplasmic/endoplasmic reticulum type n=1 Tax=Portunus trituberculatus TaxID=210409 RepID=A0A5B7KE21_PORTR|nr:Calcium-transporting ATPase sarcoplasmic/endoplasmic reticulum type [Portunus trituberculatus]